jgi:hypothetical protein
MRVIILISDDEKHLVDSTFVEALQKAGHQVEVTANIDVTAVVDEVKEKKTAVVLPITPNMPSTILDQYYPIREIDMVGWKKTKQFFLMAGGKMPAVFADFVAMRGWTRDTTQLIELLES